MRNERSLTIWSDHGNTFPGNAFGAVGLDRSYNQSPEY